jgi:uncharacterized protein (DUF1501 family)
MPSNPVDFTRRQFLRQACCSAVGTIGIASALSQLRVMGAVAADSTAVRNTAAALPSDYKALVCLFLNGGNDGNSVIIPVDPSSYSAYAAARGLLAVDRAQLLPIAPRTYADGRSYALHPALSEIRTLMTQGKAACLANVGTLVRPTTLAQYRAGTNLPRQLFSHADQLLQWQSSVPDKPFETGWGGRLADIVDSLNTNNQISMSLSLSGTNRFQIGTKSVQYAVNAGGAITLDGYNRSGGASDFRYTAVKSMMGDPQSNLLNDVFASTTKSAMEDSEVLAAALRSAPALKTVFPATPTARKLAMVAKLVSGAPALGLKRQVFFVQLGGWDLHGAQATAHAPLLREFSGAIGAFYDATVELGAANQVTTFTASDFGRTLNPNADGTDHGWGNHQFIVGGAVKGGDIYGRMPSLTIGADDDTGRGRWIPTTSVDEYNATLATWFGVSQSNLSTVLPNIGRFAKPNLGFL